MLKRLVFLVMLAALAVPAAAAAQTLDVQGPVTIRGLGPLRGELQAPDPARAVKIRFQAGRLKLVDLAGDLKVRCKGRPARSRQDADGHAVFLCAGRAGGALVQGSHYGIALAAAHYGLQIPEGVSGSLSGRFRVVEAPAESG